MTSVLGCGISKAHLLQLPPAIRSSIYLRTLPRRSFSSTSPRKSLTDIVVAGPAAVLDAVHGLGIPWYTAIPVTAVLVRCTIGYYLGALPARKRAIVRTYLSPLTSNVGKVKAREAMLSYVQRMEENGRIVPKAAMGLRFAAYQMWYNLRESHRIGKRFKAPIFTPASFVNFGMLIMFAEAIRVKCGHREGLLSMIISPFESALKSLSNDPAAKNAIEPTLSPEEVLVERMEAAQAAADAQAEIYASSAGDVLVDPKLLDPAYHFELLGQPAKTYADSLDPTMLVEGVSWAQNLALPDSTYILPLILSLTMLTGVFNRNTKSHTISTPKQREISTPKSSKVTTSAAKQTEEINIAFALADKLREENKTKAKVRGSLTSSLTLGQKFRLWMASLFFFVGCGLPSGMLLYMIPSVVVGQLHSRWLDVKYPIPNTIQPCRRPMRIKVKKEFGDV